MRDRIIRGVAGSLVLVGLTLGFLINEYYFLLTAFVGINLLQSSMSKWCLLEDILKKYGVDNRVG